MLGKIYFANGMDSMGWMMWSHALSLAEKLDLFTAPAPNSSEKERTSTTATAWGIFSQQAYESMGLSAETHCKSMF
jgi:nicotinamide riboside transporter PnuC